MTAMQELIEWMDKNKAHCTYGTIRHRATEMLEKEKQQMEAQVSDVPVVKGVNDLLRYKSPHKH